METYELNDGTTLPRIGFGTYPLRGEAGITAMTTALEAGYRLLDSAVNYRNEFEVGEALRRSGLPRDEVQITTKVAGRDHGASRAVKSIEASLETMGLDRLDLVLIHWPNPSQGKYVRTWEGLVQAREQGLVTSIGVSNFTEEYLREIISATGVTPAVNQIELHPRFPQARMRAVHAELGIQTESWSPLGKADAAYDEPAVADAASAHDVTPAQVILRWQLQIGSLPLPKSANPDRQKANLDVFGFELSGAEVEAITALGREDGRLFGGDPRTHEEM
ncbi:aldo/keto reductase [Mobilicoccus caccae]|uniref:Oxidoreductase n=1 Tax=Mobilicoccus caccae TaxID=1859295 RepID=A0ABQ6ILL6_9MICO|nr:aldo/keto reductase [Mobilicoccus caccae]GMA38636.1 oxidoreductase [Mobilicoccus caccae]